ncbi:MAG: undecaprenyl-diphosphate phosphatase [Pseudomonadota bacterium]
METETIVQAIILGFIEGLTEFIPVSSTGHILLAGEFLGFSSEGKVFEIVIQLGAILAIISVYFARLWNLFITLPSSATSRRFVAGIVLAFLPAAFAGVLLHGFIKEVLFETPIVICISLIVGGIILLWIDRLPLTPRYTDVTQYPLSLCLKIGLCQMLALVPGTSRSGATIAGSLLMGTDKRSAAEFTFFLAMPTMFGAVVFDMYKNRDVLNADDLGLIAIGFVVAFFSALLVVRKLLDFVTSYGFAPFAYWRLLVGMVGLIGLYAVA